MVVIKIRLNYRL